MPQDLASDPLDKAISEGWTLTKEMVRQTSKNQSGKQDQNVFEDVIDMRRILHTAVDAARKHLHLEPVAWSHNTLEPSENKVIEVRSHRKGIAPKRYTLAEARKLFVEGNKYLAADVTVTMHLFFNNNQTMGVLDGEPYPEQVHDQDLRVEVSLPTQSDLGTRVSEIDAVFERSSLSSNQKTISLDDAIRLFKLDPNALIWECDHVG